MNTQNITHLIPVELPNGNLVWMSPDELPGFNEGLGLFKSKSRKRVESQLPVLQKTVADQTAQINSLTGNVQKLQNSLVQKDQVIKQLNQRLSAGSNQQINIWKNPIVIGSIAFGVIGGAFGIYKALT